MILFFCHQLKSTNFNIKVKSIPEAIVDVEDNGDQMFLHWKMSGQIEELKLKAQTSKGCCFLSSIEKSNINL